VTTLTQLRKEHAELSRKIHAKETEQENAKLEAELSKWCVKIACTGCRGSGYQSRGGADIISDPPYEEACDCCCGDGWRWASTWSGRLQEHVFPDGTIAIDYY